MYNLALSSLPSHLGDSYEKSKLLFVGGGGGGGGGEGGRGEEVGRGHNLL